MSDSRFYQSGDMLLVSRRETWTLLAINAAPAKSCQEFAS
jgi:hypothetical protein